MEDWRQFPEGISERGLELAEAAADLDQMYLCIVFYLDHQIVIILLVIAHRHISMLFLKLLADVVLTITSALFNSANHNSYSKVTWACEYCPHFCCSLWW